MIKYFTFFLFFLSSCFIKAQSIYNTELIKEMQTNALTKKVQVLMLVTPGTDINFSSYQDVIFHYKAGNIYCVTASLQSIKEISQLKQVKRIEYIQHHLKVMGDTCVVRNRIKDIKAGVAPLTQPYDGTGVIVGIIDSGTDFNHPDFKDSLGNTRIQYLWDMTKPAAANTPTAFGYGQEWNSSEINLGQCTHSDVTHFGHGTNSSGIAAGNGRAINHYAGMAPKADIIVVALDFNRPGFTISDALQYIITKSQLINKPLVVNASIGDYYGSHDGTDLETQVINNLVSNIPGRAMVAACGNGGAYPFHVGYSVLPTDTNFTWITGTTSQINVSEFADTNQIKQVSYSIGVNNPAFSNLGRTSFKPYNHALNTLKRDTIYHNTNRIGIIESIASINSFGVYELALTIRADSLNYLWRLEHTGTGRIDSWNFDYVTSSLPTATLYPQMIHYKIADTMQTIVSGFQCSDEIISVANYVNRSQYVDVNHVTQTTTEVAGNLSESSSTGPTRDNRIKPDVAASGATILAASPLDWIPTLIANAPYLVAEGGYHVTAGGTSASCPVVSGLVALYLQKNPTATNQQIKQAITHCTYSDVYTTTSLPNYAWGYGKLDGFKAMTCGIATDVRNLAGNLQYIQVIPNPFSNETNLVFMDNGLKKLRLYNSSGQLVFEESCSCKDYVLKNKGLPTGIYFLVSEEQQSVSTQKLMIY